MIVLVFIMTQHNKLAKLLGWSPLQLLAKVTADPDEGIFTSALKNPEKNRIQKYFPSELCDNLGSPLITQST